MSTTKPSSLPYRFNRGTTILSVLLAMIIVTVGGYFYLDSSNRNHITVLHNQDLVVATQFAEELVEVFRSMTNTELANYLFTSSPHFTVGVPPLCAQINILDRSTGGMYNPDTNATIPQSSPGNASANPVVPPFYNPLDRGTAATNSNRYYQVQVINPTNLLPIVPLSPSPPSPCGVTTLAAFNNAMSSITGASSLSLTPTGASLPAVFLVSVSVTFIPRGGSVKIPQRTVVSTLIPES